MRVKKLSIEVGATVEPLSSRLRKQGTYIVSKVVCDDCILWNVSTGFIRVAKVSVRVTQEPEKTFRQILFVDSKKAGHKLVSTYIGSPAFFSYVHRGYSPACVLTGKGIKVSEFINSINN